MKRAGPKYATTLFLLLWTTLLLDQTATAAGAPTSTSSGPSVVTEAAEPITIDCSDPAQSTPEACGVPGPSTAEEVTYSATGKVVSRRLFAAATQGSVLGTATTTKTGAQATNDSGGGGSSSASGCRKVTLHNYRYSYLGSLLYTWDTWTYWCWVRSVQNINNVSTGQRFYPDDQFIDWQGVIDKEKIFYDYGSNDGYPRSAYKHWQQAKVSNVVFGTTTGTVYPENLIRSYYNGTWVWETVE